MRPLVKLFALESKVRGPAPPELFFQIARWTLKGGEWRPEWRMEDGAWRLQGGGWRLENEGGGRRTEAGR